MFRLPLLLAVGLYGVSLFLPVYAAKPDLIGAYALLAGWMTGLNDIPTAISWLANVTFFFGIIFILRKKNPKPKTALVFSVLSIVLGAAFLGAGKAFVGYSETVGKLAIGTSFYAWEGSFVLLAAASYLKLQKTNSPLPQSSPTTTDGNLNS